MATIFGTTGNDTINASYSTPTTAGSDIIYGLAGDDFIVRSLGNDTIDGGAGFDTLDFSGTTNRVVVNVVAGTLRELSGITLVKLDMVTSIEEFRTGSGDDNLTGSGADEQFRPGLGRDTILGGGGSDGILYTDATTRVFVDLARGFAIDHGGFRDSLSSIEYARGGSGNDVLRGGIESTLLRGNLGNDTLISAWDGTPANNFGVGVDYNERTAGSAVTVDLAAGYAQIGAERDTLIGNFYQVRGGAGADTLLGNDLDNVFRPRNGADVIDGRGGFDRIDYRDETGPVSVTMTALYSGTAIGSDGLTDTLTSIEWVRGSTFNDTLQTVGAVFVQFGAYAFHAGDTPALEGWIGDDTLIGQAGAAVIARYTSDQGPIFVNLAAGFAIDQWGGIDTLINIWGIRGSAFDDIITLGAGNEWARGDAGADILDGGAGIDRVTYDGAPGSVIVDLAAGTAQDGWGSIDTISNFEVVTGSAQDDQLFGDANSNWFIGGGGNDLIDGRGGSDTVVYFFNGANVIVDLAGGTGFSLTGPDTLVSIENAIGSTFSDWLTGSAGANELYGYLGDDFLQGGAGNDLLDGGDGQDTAQYQDAPSRVVVNLALAGPQNTQGAGIDTLVSIENLFGSFFNDTLTGNTGANFLMGFSGNDAIFGGDGDDTIDGGPGDDIMQGQGGIDTADYGSAGAGVTVSLLLQGSYQNTIGDGNDYLNGFENLRGSFFADTLTGNAAGNLIEGGSGNDIINGGDGNDTLDGGNGDDTLIGGNGTDTASYASAFYGVTVSLALQGIAQDTIIGGLDTLSGFENLSGSAFDDVLTGDAGANTLRGGDGNDILEGGLGNDLLYGGAGIDLASYANAAGPVTVTLNAFSGTGSAGTDYFYDIEGFIGSAFNDTLTGNAGDNVLIGGDGDDRLYGLAGNDRFVGGAGNDQYYGGDGIDTVDYSGATLALRAILGGAGFVNTLNYGSDLFSSIENLIGGQANDILTGDANANRLEGRGGNDTIDGGAGDDVILGGEGNDTLTGGLGADLIDLGTGFDIVRYVAAAESRAASMDRIVNFTQNGGDGFDRIGFENNANALFAGVTLTAIALGARVAIEAASTMDDLLAQISGLAASTANTLSVTQVDVGFGGVAGRYLVVNDTTAAFNSATDMLVSIGMAPGSATNLTAANFFLF